MFILKDEIKAWWPVKVKEPNPSSAGTFTTYKFEVEFTLLDQDETNNITDARNALLKDENIDAGNVVREVQSFDANQYANQISDWRGVFDNDKREVPYSREMLFKALKRPHILMAIAEAYEDMANGGGRRKN